MRPMLRYLDAALEAATDWMDRRLPGWLSEGLQTPFAVMAALAIVLYLRCGD